MTSDHHHSLGAGNQHSPAPSSPDRVSELRDELFGIKLWLEFNLEKHLEPRVVTDGKFGPIVNSYGGVVIPDWDVKQKLQSIAEVLGDSE